VLLLTHDSAQTDTFPLTQEFAAYLLGLHRPAVSIAANALQDARLIRYRQGKLTVQNRKGLEAASCECYKIIRGAYTHLLDGLLTTET
jgi:Crp-like helix-turn-helix domain